MICDQGTDGLNLLVGADIIEGETSKLLACRKNPPPKKILFLVEHPDLPITKTLRRVLDLLTVINLKRVSESIVFQINKINSLIWHSIY